ncbi:MAG TPA: alanine--glyoxylate aminotransferase family protein [Candidatus Polarisedimenticolaceae bacterium]|nr:alanine--glyoxylate aminotransferase family protein [Candidatus Polarisedimenticolaceae bacterium]
MTSQRRLVMIPGPIEISPGVREAFSVPPPGHTSPEVIETFGASLEMMRRVWIAAPGAQPFVIPGSGTTTMEMAVANLVEPGDAVVVVNTGFFSDRMVDMLRRAGAEVVDLTAVPGDVPHASRAEGACEDLVRSGRRPKAIFATHVDTSTGVRCDPKPLAAIAREHGALSIFDGVCATAAERFEMETWGADVYLTASQKAIGLPPGLALLVVTERALEAREARRAPVPLSLDWHSWRPVMQAYEARKPSYFATPPTNLILALEVGLREILAEGMNARFALHERGAGAMRAAFAALGLRGVPAKASYAAHTLSALRFPSGVDAGLVGKIAERGVVVAGGLHPAIKAEYFRIGHMGYALTRPDMLMRTIEAVGSALEACNHPADTAGAVKAMLMELQAPVS